MIDCLCSLLFCGVVTLKLDRCVFIYFWHASFHMIMENFKVLEKLGEGSYGCVIKATDLLTGEIVAIKKCKIKSRESYGIPYWVIREVTMLKELRHKNIVKLKKVITRNLSSRSMIGLVFDYYPMTLSDYLGTWESRLPDAVIKRIMKQIFEAIYFTHSKHVIHRDLKPQNIMITNDLVVKVGDFGLARYLGYPFHYYTKEVMTLNYRCPEIIFGQESYNLSADMWSIGCILGELYRKKPIFLTKNNNTVELLYAIACLIGVPSPQEWPALLNLSTFRMVNYSSINSRCNLDSIIPRSNALYPLLKMLLVYNPDHRITAREALDTFFHDV